MAEDGIEAQIEEEVQLSVGEWVQETHPIPLGRRNYGSSG
jgi:hypothetical protein